MATLVTTSLLVVLIPVVFGNGPKNISAHVGDSVTLPCNTSGIGNFEDVAVEWTRPDLDSHQYVFNYRDGRPDPDEQDPSYKDRVDLVHSPLKDGNLSVVLKNLTRNDSGMFECHVIQVLENQRGPISSINLMVSDPGSSGNRKDTRDEGGPDGTGNLLPTVGWPVIVVLMVIGVIVVTKVVPLMSRRRQDSSRSPSVVSSGDQVDQCPTVSVESKV